MREERRKKNTFQANTRTHTANQWWKETNSSNVLKYNFEVL